MTGTPKPDIPGTTLFDGFPPLQAWLARAKPDVAVIFYNDHGLNFFLDKLPTFAVGAAPERLTRLSMHELVREAGAQGTELMTWIAARGALPAAGARAA